MTKDGQKKERIKLNEGDRYLIVGFVMLLISLALFPQLFLSDSIFLVILSITTILIGIKKKFCDKMYKLNNIDDLKNY